MSEYWDSKFTSLFNSSCEKYRNGIRDLDSYYDQDDLKFLESIGYKKREFFDFVEDHCDSSDQTPSPETSLLIASVRRDYFLNIQKGIHSKEEIVGSDLPTRDEKIGDYPWLPRIIKKAEGKLRGELDSDIMYFCAGDRKFLSSINIHPADFLKLIWYADGSADQILNGIE